MVTHQKEQKTSDKISAREAAEAASRFYSEATGTFPRISLEELEYLDGFWYVTLSIDKGTLYEQKDFKSFKVHGKTGNVESMLVKKHDF